MPRLTLKQRAKRVKEDLTALKIADRLKAEYGQRMLVCHHEKVMSYRMKANMIDDLVDEVTTFAEKGELQYGRTNTRV